MAKVTLHPMLKSIHGKLGNVVFRRSYTGEMSLIKLADMSNVQWSDAQKNQRQRFKAANAYAKAAMAEPAVWAVYERRVAAEHKRPYHLAVSDYFKGNDLLARK
ncbi:MAG: hypothetical protein ABI904_05195 [Chloroflexota bacterium]